MTDNTLANVTKEQMIHAFEAWENGFRVNHANFYTPEETAAMGVTQVSVERADYFFELLKVEQAKG